MAEMVAQGMTPLAISRLPAMPGAHDIRHWENQYPKFRDAMKVARAAHAEVLADSALEIADRSTWQTAKADKIKVETALKLAACWDPDRYGSKTKISGDPNAPLTFLIDTGIRREGDTGEPKRVELDYSDPGKHSEKDVMDGGPESAQ